MVESQFEVCMGRSIVRKECRTLVAVVPQENGAERLQRYESSLERSIDRALAQLERLQRYRLDQAVPLPLKVELSQ